MFRRFLPRTLTRDADGDHREAWGESDLICEAGAGTSCHWEVSGKSSLICGCISRSTRPRRYDYLSITARMFTLKKGRWSLWIKFIVDKTNPERLMQYFCRGMRRGRVREGRDASRGGRARIPRFVTQNWFCPQWLLSTMFIIHNIYTYTQNEE